MSSPMNFHSGISLNHFLLKNSIRRELCGSFYRHIAKCGIQAGRFYGSFENKSRSDVLQHPFLSTEGHSTNCIKNSLPSTSFAWSCLNGHGNENSLPFPSPFHFDPPFTEIPGERDAFARKEVREAQVEGNCFVVVYTCRRCNTPIFISKDAALFQAPANHSSGWPTFFCPVSPFTLVYRHDGKALKSSTQCTTSLSARGFCAEGDLIGEGKGGKFVSRSKVYSPLEFAINKCRRQGSSHRYATSSSSLLKKESLLLHSFPLANSTRRGAGVTWRERCIRDSNQRADPIPIEGCCQLCGSSVCRLLPRSKKEGEKIDNSTPQKSKNCANAQQFIHIPANAGISERTERVFRYEKCKYTMQKVFYVSTASTLNAVVGYLNSDDESLGVKKG